MRPVEAVVFDVGRVIVQWDLRHLFARLISDRGELDRFLGHVVTPEWHFEHDAGRPLDAMVAERKALFPEHASLIDAYRARFLETIPGPVPGMVGLIEELHGAGVPLYAITNFGAEFWERFAPTMPVFDLFRDIVVSGRERMIKPDRAIYELAARRFGYSPAAMLFVDDNAENIAAADRLGWQTHLFRDAEALGADLARRGLIAEGKGVSAATETPP